MAAQISAAERFHRLKWLVVQALAIFRRFPNSPAEAVVSHLKSVSGEGDVAERLFEFVPIAFVRVFFADSGVQFQETFSRLTSRGKLSHSCPLASDSLWGPALEVAREEQMRHASEADLVAVMRHSGLFDSLREAKAAGYDLKGGVASPNVFLRPAPMPCKAPRPWWKFWGTAAF